jgi:hypothetical protein
MFQGMHVVNNIILWNTSRQYMFEGGRVIVAPLMELQMNLFDQGLIFIKKKVVF